MANPMPDSLRSTLDNLAQAFAAGVLAAIRSASLDDVLAESTGANRRGPGRPKVAGAARSTTAKGGRLARRSAEQIQDTLKRVVIAIRATRGKGLRAEQLRQQLGLDVREVPRVLHEGLRARKLRSKGAKRSTTYFVR